MSNVGKWNGRYSDLKAGSPVSYGDDKTYVAAASVLADCKEIEDWGCGSGGFMRYRPDAIGIDGSDTVFATKKFIDLREYTSSVEAIHMRHVLEHDREWKKILANALASAKKRLVVTMFVPPYDGPEEVIGLGAVGVADDIVTLRINRTEFMNEIYKSNPEHVKSIKMTTGSDFGGNEEIFCITTGYLGRNNIDLKVMNFAQSDDYVGINLVGDMIIKEYWGITCPCGIKVTYGINELPIVDTPHPCGNPKHWTVKYKEANT